jgi:hypothetical protein
MWTKDRNLQTILDLALPKDGKWHDVQLINNELYIDGKLISWQTSNEEYIMLDRLLNDKEIDQLYHSLFPIENDEDE